MTLIVHSSPPQGNPTVGRAQNGAICHNPGMSRLQQIREEKGLSRAQVAEAVGISVSHLTKLERGERGLTERWMTLLAPTLGCAPADLVAQGDVLLKASPAPASNAPAPNVDLSAIRTEGLVGARDLPVFASAQGGPDGEMIVSFEPIEWVRRPEPLEGVKGGFSFYMVGDSMSPVYEPGDMILCHPTRPPYAGQDVLVIRRLNGCQCALVKRLVRLDSEGLKLHQFSPARDVCVPKEDVVSYHLVVGKYNRR